MLKLGRNAAGLRGLPSSPAFLAGSASIAAAAGSAGTAGRFAADSPRNHRHGCRESLDNVTGTVTPCTLARPLTANAYLLLISSHISSPLVDPYPHSFSRSLLGQRLWVPAPPLSDVCGQGTAKPASMAETCGRYWIAAGPSSRMNRFSSTASGYLPGGKSYRSILRPLAISHEKWLSYPSAFQRDESRVMGNHLADHGDNLLWLHRTNRKYLR